MKNEIKQILFELRDKVDKCIPAIVRSIKDIEDRMYEVEKENRLYIEGELMFEFSTEKKQVNGELMDFDEAFVSEVVDFQFILAVTLMRHHPTDLKIRMEKGWIKVFEKAFMLLDFNDCLHMEEEKHHEEIIRVMRERLNEIDLDEMAAEIERKIK